MNHSFAAWIDEKPSRENVQMEIDATIQVMEQLRALLEK
jgi:hypothetical protein